MALTEVKQTFVKPFFDGLTQPSDAWKGGFDMLTDDVAAMKLASMTGIGRVPVWDGSSDVDQAFVNDLFNTTLTYTKYALQVRLNKFEVRDLPRVVADAGTRLGVSIANTYGSIAADRLADVFSATTSAGDGKALVADDHPTRSGAVRDNKMTSAFDRTSYLAAVNLASLWVNYENDEDDWSGDPLCFYGSPSDTTLRETAFEVFGSAVSSSQMQANAAAQYRPDEVLWAKLTDSTRWMLLSKLRMPLIFWVRAGAETNTVIDEDNLSYKITTSFAIGTAAKPDPAGIIGSDA